LAIVSRKRRLKGCGTVFPKHSEVNKLRREKKNPEQEEVMKQCKDLQRALNAVLTTQIDVLGRIRNADGNSFKLYTHKQMVERTRYAEGLT